MCHLVTSQPIRRKESGAAERKYSINTSSFKVDTRYCKISREEEKLYNRPAEDKCKV
jgi:hypothetical protein